MILLKNTFWLLLTTLACLNATALNAQVRGCTDSKAANFNALATQNDGSCTYNSAIVDPTEAVNLESVLNESSGLIMWNNKLWTHNDDTDIHLYELSPADVKTYARHALNGAVNNDWEEISQDENYIYVGDFGNNASGNRRNLRILRVSKLSLSQNNPSVEYIPFSYELQTDFTPTTPNKTNFDCEAFVVAGDSIYLFTKEWLSKKTSLYALPKSLDTHIAKFKGVYDVQGLITGATYVSNRNLVALCGYSDMLQPFILLLYDFEKHHFLAANKRKINLNHSFHQVEGITTTDGLNYYISNERFSQSIISVDAKLSKVNLSTYLTDYLNTFTSQVLPSMIPFKSYPNPTHDFLRIDVANSNNTNIKIFTMCGQLEASESFPNGSIQLSVQNLQNGLHNYLIESSQGPNYYGKFIVKK